MDTSDDQVVFKKQHSTDMYFFARKLETIL